ncbi:unnamed protein product, partial [Laminaria digitata]
SSACSKARSPPSAQQQRMDVDGAGGLLMSFIESLTKQHRLDQAQLLQKQLAQQDQQSPLVTQQQQNKNEKRCENDVPLEKDQPQQQQQAPKQIQRQQQQQQRHQRPTSASSHAFPRIRHKHAARMEREANLAAAAASASATTVSSRSSGSEGATTSGSGSSSSSGGGSGSGSGSGAGGGGGETHNRSKILPPLAKKQRRVGGGELATVDRPTGSTRASGGVSGSGGSSGGGGGGRGSGDGCSSARDAVAPPPRPLSTSSPLNPGAMFQRRAESRKRPREQAGMVDVSATTSPPLPSTQKCGGR